METLTNRTVFTPAQTAIINAVAHLRTDEEVMLLKRAISHFFFERANQEMDKLWETGAWNEQTLEDLKTAHHRTPYVTP